VILSKSATYAVRSTLKLSEERDGSPVRVDDIADALGVPRNYLSKILHQLARTRILESEIVEHFDDVPAEDACLLGRGRCSAEHPCGAHERWSEVRAVIKGFLEDTSLEDLARDPSADERLELSSITSEVPD
jgi:DNA-binding IscR family transcriptional regulator